MHIAWHSFGIRVLQRVLVLRAASCCVVPVRTYVWHSLSYCVFVADMFGPHSRQSSLTVFGRVGGHLPPRRFRRRVLPPVLLPVLVAVPAAVLGQIRVQSVVSSLTCLPSDSRCLRKPYANMRHLTG